MSPKQAGKKEYEIIHFPDRPTLRSFVKKADTIDWVLVLPKKKMNVAQ